MKLKFRASVKDVVIFIIFCIFLLYLVAIGVMNLHYFSNYGYFYGFNPFPAFGSEFIITTLVFYLLALVGVFMSVSSYFFDREKGIGYTSKKKDEYGWAKWMDAKEMKEAYDIKKITLINDEYDHAGVPIINDGKNAWVDDGENHTLIIGSSGSGKTQCIMHPAIKILGKRGESMIVTDPKGELYEESANMLRDKGYKVIILNFRDPEYGNAWNPFSLPYRLYKDGNKDKAQELLEDLALNILYDPNNKGEPFWEKSAADYFSGLALGLFEDAKDESEVNLNSINAMGTFGEEKIGASTYIKEYMKLKGELSPVYIMANNTASAPADTKGGILSVFRQKIRIFSSREKLSEMLSYSDFDIRDIGKEKTAVFLKIHDEKTTYHALATVFVKQVYESLIDVAQSEDNLKLKFRTNFILDEFANLPPLKDVETMITAARSRNIRFNFAIQNFSQLNKVYGKDVAETIKGNCGNMIFLITTEYQALEEISKLCGEEKPKVEKDKPQPPIRPLVSVSDLQNMKKFEVLIKRYRNNPFKIKLEINAKINWGKDYGKSEYEHRDMPDVKVFDLKAFINERKKDQPMDFPAFGNNPFVPPFAGMGAFGSNDRKETVNVDDLVKRIDAKIAELEEEERVEKNKAPITHNVVDTKTNEINEIINNNVSIEDINTVVNEAHKPIDDDAGVNEDEKPIENTNVEVNQVEKPKVNVDADSIIVNDNITDDDFFDDFFGDDDI